MIYQFYLPQCSVCAQRQNAGNVHCDGTKGHRSLTLPNHSQFCFILLPFFGPSDCELVLAGIFSHLKTGSKWDIALFSQDLRRYVFIYSFFCKLSLCKRDLEMHNNAGPLTLPTLWLIHFMQASLAISFVPLFYISQSIHNLQSSGSQIRVTVSQSSDSCSAWRGQPVRRKTVAIIPQPWILYNAQTRIHRVQSSTSGSYQLRSAPL